MQFLFKTESFSLFELPIFQLPGLGVNFATSCELQKLVHVLLVAEMNTTFKRLYFCSSQTRPRIHIIGHLRFAGGTSHLYLGAGGGYFGSGARFAGKKRRGLNLTRTVNGSKSWA